MTRSPEEHKTSFYLARFAVLIFIPNVEKLMHIHFVISFVTRKNQFPIPSKSVSRLVLKVAERQVKFENSYIFSWAHPKWRVGRALRAKF